MALPIEAMFSLATAALLAGPVFILWAAFGRVRGRKTLLVALAVSVFLASDLAIFAGASVWQGATDWAEPVELVSDVLVAAFLAAAFMWPAPRGDATAK